jgi:glyoxylase-like metal-dependent hydrolase (beta-lactamase superfamily II)
MKTKTGAMGLVLVLHILFAGLVGHASAPETKIKWFGHSAFSITTPDGKVLLIDPWLRNPSNPEAKDGKDPLVLVPRVDYILLTHGHRDHVGDAVEIARKTGAALIANPELAANLLKLADFNPKAAPNEPERAYGGNPAGFVIAVRELPDWVRAETWADACRVVNSMMDLSTFCGAYESNGSSKIGVYAGEGGPSTA